MQLSHSVFFLTMETDLFAETLENLQNMIGLISENRSYTLNSDDDNIRTILFIFFNNASVFVIEEIAKAKQDDRNVP